MYSEPRIVTTEHLELRSYVCFYFKGKRIREYNGKSIGLIIQPNSASSIKERNKLLKKLEFELKKALENDRYPLKNKNPEPKEDIIPNIITTHTLLKNALDKKLSSSLSKFYKRNLSSIYNHFTEFLSQDELDEEIIKLKVSRIDEFLARYNSSGTYYMNKRRDLGVLFASISKQIDQRLVLIKETERRRSKAKLHKVYEDDQIKPILNYLKRNHPNLHLCCLISYGCFLRPHQEVRNLRGYHFKNNFNEIHLSGDENKGGRVRVVFVPDYVKKEIEPLIPLLKPNINLFTLTEEPFNEAYFNTAWTRIWKKMFKEGLIHRNQTIYSFRHTAAINVYHKTKDVHILQQLLGHSDMIVTLKYLRGLGELNKSQLRENMPSL